MMRVRNEEDNIRQSIESLDALTVPYEIIVILNCCTDRTESIVRELMETRENISLHHYDYPLSRAGFETLVTPKDSPHSLCAFNEFARSKCTMRWIFKWDGDMEATPALLKYLDGVIRADHPGPTTVRIPAVAPDCTNAEIYMSNCFVGVNKYAFWEVFNFSTNTEIRSPQDAIILHRSKLDVPKSYWFDPSWWNVEPHRSKYSETAEHLRKRYDVLREVLKLPQQMEVGIARASNPACDKYFRMVLDRQGELARHGIHIST